MFKSFFIASARGPVKTPKAVLSALRGIAKWGRAAYFKPILDRGEAADLEAAAALSGQSGDVSDFYALSLVEALALAAEGRYEAIIDAVLAKYAQLANLYDLLVIGGLEQSGPSALAKGEINALLAANLGSPLILLAEAGKGLVESAATAQFYQNRQAELFAVAIFSDQPQDLATDQIPSALREAQVWTMSAPEDLDSYFESAGASLLNYSPRAMTPKRFEFNLIEDARTDQQHIVLPEGDDRRILIAADEILKKDFAKLTILGDPVAIKKEAAALGLTRLDQAELIDHRFSPMLPEMAANLAELRKAKGLTVEGAQKALQDRNWFATMLVKMKKADGMVSGAAGSTADTIRPALSIIKTQPGCSIASSVFLMCLADRVWVFGDCAINPNPTPAQLAEIALMSSETALAFGIKPKVAMLSYSTGTSGAGADVEAVAEAVKIAQAAVKERLLMLDIDGPLQFDAAVSAQTAASKRPGSKVAGAATVMIFPDLNSGNIAYKAVQRTAKAVAIGPIIQGLNAPVNDLSRGCLVPDIVNTVAITALQAKRGKGQAVH